MRRLLLSFVALLMLAGTVTVPASAGEAERRHPRPGQHREHRGYREHRREYRESYRRGHRPSWSYQRYRHYGYYRRQCRYYSGYWDHDRYGWYFVRTGSYIAACR
jgi:Ni/Co efflux regulator RcnB